MSLSDPSKDPSLAADMAALRLPASSTTSNLWLTTRKQLGHGMEIRWRLDLPTIGERDDLYLAIELIDSKHLDRDGDLRHWHVRIPAREVRYLETVV